MSKYTPQPVGNFEFDLTNRDKYTLSPVNQMDINILEGVALTSPIAGATGVALDAPLVWEALGDIDRYRVVVRLNSDNSIVYDQKVKGTEFAPPENWQSQTLYNWQVFAQRGVGTTPPSSIDSIGISGSNTLPINGSRQYNISIESTGDISTAFTATSSDPTKATVSQDDDVVILTYVSGDVLDEVTVTVEADADNTKTDSIVVTITEALGYSDDEAGDLQALKDIADVTDFDNWTNVQENDRVWDLQATQLPEPDANIWFGVQTEIINGERRVIHLDLQSGTHSPPTPGSLPDGYSVWGDPIGNNLSNSELVNGEWVLIAGKDFPDSIGNLQECEYFNVKHNNLSGAIPDGYSNMRSCIRQLWSGHPREPNFGTPGQFSPASATPSNHPSATGIPSSEGDSKLNQALNNWESILESDVSAMQELEVFEASGTGSLTGNIPDFWNLPKIKGLFIHRQNFTGGLPAHVGNATTLRIVQMFGNPNLGGEIPASMGNWTDCYELRISGCGFTGVIPETFGNFVGLRMLTFSHNPFDPQPFPSFLFNGDAVNTGGITYRNELLSLWLFNNANIVSMPETFLTNIYDRVSVIQIENNNIDQEVPAWLTDFPRLIILNISNNDFFGELPAEFHNPDSRIYSGGEQYATGRIRNLYFHRNLNLTGALPSVNFNSTSLQNLYFYQCDFNGSLPVEWGDIVTNDSNRDLDIRLHQNNLAGYVDPTIAGLEVNGAGREWIRLEMLTGNNFSSSDLEDFEAELANNHPNLTIT